MKKEAEFIEQIYPYQPLIYKVCLIYAKDKEDLCDLFQESLLNLWIAFPKFRGECKMSTWIYRIALNTCINDLRKKKRIIQVPLCMDLEVYEDCEKMQQLQEMYMLIRQLGKIDRALILLWLDEKSYEEIAQIMQLSKSNVSVRLCRIKEKLKQMSDC